MNDPAIAAAPLTRGPHVERTASMRRRLIEAAVTCLRRVGYAATTTQRVLDEAGVSRGAMLHHFPAKIDLIIAVAEYAADFQNGFVADRLAHFGPGLDGFMAVTQATWEAMNQPPALALVEIMVASRSDPDLAARFPAVAHRLEAVQGEAVWQAAQALGIQNRDAVDRMVRLHRAALRGLALEVVISGDRPTADACVELLEWYKKGLTDELLARGDRPLLVRTEKGQGYRPQSDFAKTRV